MHSWILDNNKNFVLKEAFEADSEMQMGFILKLNPCPSSAFCETRFTSESQIHLTGEFQNMRNCAILGRSKVYMTKQFTIVHFLLKS